MVEPYPDLVQAFEALVGPTDGRIALHEAEAQTSSELRDAVLPMLISGELRVTEAEKVAEAVACVARRRDGRSEFDRPNEHQLGEWLEEYAVGDLWRMNVVGGNRSL